MESVEIQEDQDDDSESLDECDSEEEPELKGLDDNAAGQETEAQIEMPEETEISNSVEPGTPIPSTSQPIENPNDLKLDELQISDESNRSLSRSPPRSQRQEDKSNHKNDSIKAIVSSDMTKKRSQQQRKYHSKRSTRNAGRQTGSKAKQDKRVKLGEHHSVWD
jgi:RIO kinase 2